MVDEQVIFNNPGRSAAILRRLDWSRTSLGKPDDWPEALRLSVKTRPMRSPSDVDLVGRRTDTILQRLFCAYRSRTPPCARPRCAGQTFWRRTWQQIGPDVQHVMSGQGGISREHQFIDSASSPASGAHFWSYSINPIFDQHRVGAPCFFVATKQREAAARQPFKCDKQSWYVFSRSESSVG